MHAVVGRVRRRPVAHHVETIREAIFCAIETTGDGAVNVQSRVLMDLFKARQKAQKEYSDLLEAAGLTEEEAARGVRQRRLDSSLFYPRHVVAGTAANTIVELRPAAKRSIKSHKAAPSVATKGVQTKTAPVLASARLSAMPAGNVASAPVAVSKVAFRDGVLNLVPVRRPSAESAVSSAAR